jgi:hypothetical protein
MSNPPRRRRADRRGLARMTIVEKQRRAWRRLAAGKMSAHTMKIMHLDGERGA